MQRDVETIFRSWTVMFYHGEASFHTLWYETLLARHALFTPFKRFHQRLCKHGLYRACTHVHAAFFLQISLTNPRYLNRESFINPSRRAFKLPPFLLRDRNEKRHEKGSRLDWWMGRGEFILIGISSDVLLIHTFAFFFFVKSGSSKVLEDYLTGEFEKSLLKGNPF